VEAVGPQFEVDLLRFWAPAELLAEIRVDRRTAGAAFEYGNVNYVLLGLVVEALQRRAACGFAIRPTRQG
jgi:CubicO group peptidase (beta-lactamase class C family)